LSTNFQMNGEIASSSVAPPRRIESRASALRRYASDVFWVVGCGVVLASAFLVPPKTMGPGGLSRDQTKLLYFFYPHHF